MMRPLPLLGSGKHRGIPWRLYGRIEDGVAEHRLVLGTRVSGGTEAALPFATAGGRKLGHFGGIAYPHRRRHAGSGEHELLGVHGVVSSATTAVEVGLADGTTTAAQLIDARAPEAQFFVAIWSGDVEWVRLVARDGETELELRTPHE